MPELYVPGSHGEEEPIAGYLDDDNVPDAMGPYGEQEHGYDIPKPSGADEDDAAAASRPEFRTAFLVLIDNEGMAQLRFDPNEMELISVDRPAIPNDVFLACTMLLRDMNLTSVATAAAETIMATMMHQAQAAMQQQAHGQALDINAQREKARIDEARRRGGR